MPTRSPSATRRSVLAAVAGGPLLALPGATAAPTATPPASATSHVPFAVRDVDADEVVAEGVLSDPVEDDVAGQTVAYAGGTGIEAGATYAFEAGGASSYPFAVGEGVYDRLLAEACRVYTCKRAGTAVDDPLTGLDVAAGHEQDAEARLYFSDPYHDEGDAIDVSGGWYDAGDYGKYVPTGAVTVGELLHAYEGDPGAFAAGQLSLPDGHGEPGVPDLLAEVRFELEWLARMQRPDGAVYHKVAGDHWPGMVAPAEDTQTRYVFGLSTYGTAMFAAAMALAARVYEPFDPTFADRVLGHAEDAWAWLRDTPDPHFRRDEGQDAGSGAYEPGNLTRADEGARFWAAAELLATTGDPAYDDYLAAELDGRFDDPPGGASWANPLALGQWAYHGAAAADEGRRDRVADAFRSAADALVDRAEADGYGCALTRSEYVWGSAKIALSKGTILLLANEITPDAAYEAAALEQLNAVLGRSATGSSYVTHAGSQYPRNPHDRIVESQGVLLPGMVVGGPNAGSAGGDPALESLRAENPDLAPARQYVDDVDSYATNEWAIDYTAALVRVLARLVDDPEPLSAFDPDYGSHPETEGAGGVRTNQVGYPPAAAVEGVVPQEAVEVDLAHGDDGDGGDGADATGADATDDGTASGDDGLPGFGVAAGAIGIAGGIVALVRRGGDSQRTERSG